MFLIPAIDIIDGKCVRLSQGDYGKKTVYEADPVELSLKFNGHGIKKLHLVDLDGAVASHIVNWRVLEKIVNKTELSVDFGGGLKSDEDLRIAFECGAKQITAGSIAVKDEEKVKEWLKKFGSEKIILGADVKDGKIAINGWKTITDFSVEELLEKYLPANIKYCICTDIGKDGMLKGSSLALYQTLCDQFQKISFVASGGVSSMEECDRLLEIGCYGAIIGKAFFEGKISLTDMENWILNQK